MKAFKILLVAGGTGGHIFPALSFGKWIKKEIHNSSVFYVSGSRSMEKDIYGYYGIEAMVLPLDGSPQGSKGLTAMIRWKNIFLSYFIALKWFSRLRPDFICLFGGYLSLPVMMAAKTFSVPLLLHEQNARAGRVTRLAKKWNIPVASGWPQCEPFKSGETFFTGIPVRPIERLQRNEAWHKLGTGCVLPAGPMLFILGGSLGSVSLGSLATMIASHHKFRDWLVVEVGTVSQVTWEGGHLLRVPRAWNVECFFSLADLVLCRGGASSLWELLLWHIPAVVAPWRGASDDHQLANAACFESLGGGLLWREGVDRPEDIPDLLETAWMRCRKRPTGRKSFSSSFSGDNVCRSLWRVLTDTDRRERAQ